MGGGTESLLPSEPNEIITVASRTAGTRLNAVCPYYTMFPLTFPLSALKTAEAQAAVLDPFCGRGTTNFAARLLGLPTYGVDASPIAVSMAKAKLISAEPETVIHLCEHILSSHAPDEVPEGDFWNLCYEPTTLRNICKLREYFLERCETPEEIMLRAIVMGILHGPVNKGAPTYLSNQMPRTYASKPASAVRYWEAWSMTPAAVDVLDCVRRRTHYVLADVPAPVEGEIVLADSATFDYTSLGREFDHVITSPPYLGMVTYVPDQWIRNWFVGGPPDVVYEAGAQLGRGSEVDFTQALRTVWNRVSQASREGTKLVVRFGALPSMPTNPAEVVADSLRGTPWVLREVRRAGFATAGKRQAKQFQFVKKSPIEEVDVHAVLGG